MTATVIGIAGPSCSGKSTVARLVANEMGASLLHLDAHWIRGSHRPMVNGQPTFERPEQYDGAALATEIRAHRIQVPGTPVVVEGFLLHLYPECVSLCGLRVFLDVPVDVMTERRSARSLAAGDHSGGGKRSAAERAWLANGIEEWTAFGAAQAEMPGVVVVDATRLPHEVAADVISLARAFGSCASADGTAPGSR